MNITNFVTGVTANITNQITPKSIPASVVGNALVDLANLTKTNVDAISASTFSNSTLISGQTSTINALQTGLTAYQTINDASVNGIKSTLSPISAVIKNTTATEFNLVDGNGFSIAKSLANGSVQFVELLSLISSAGLINTDSLNLKNIAINNVNKDYAFVITDANGYISFAIKFDGTIVSSQTSTVPVIPNYGDLETLIPKRVYSLSNDLPGSKKYCRIYLDHLIKLNDTSKNNIRFDNGKDYIDIIPKETNGQNVTTEVIPLKTVTGNWNPISASTTHLSTRTSAGEFTKVIIGGAGDSQTYGAGSGYENSTTTNDVYWMQMLCEYKKLNIDTNGTYRMVLPVGNLVKWSRTFQYKNTGYTVTGCFNGVSSTTVIDWLKHTELGSRMRTVSQGSWDLKGLGNGSGTDLTSSTSQKLLYSQTCEGQNSPTLTGALFNWLGLGTASTISSGITTAEQNAITVECNNRLNTPQNPYFDKDKTGLHRFSINKWLSRYKTLANDGLTRLVTGSTAGSKVTNVNDYDVCLPTHFIFKFSQNDTFVYGTTGGANYAADMQLAITAVKEEYPNMPVGLIPVDTNSTYFTDLYPNFLIPKKVVADYHYDFMKALYTDFYTNGKGQNEDANKAWIVPFFWTMPTAWGWNMTKMDSTLTDNPIVAFPPSSYYFTPAESSAEYHPGGFTHQDWGYQLMSWLTYTLTL